MYIRVGAQQSISGAAVLRGVRRSPLFNIAREVKVANTMRWAGGE